MPEEGMTWLDRDQILTFEEIERLAKICVHRFDVESIRLTGGEPTVRAHLPMLVEKLAQLKLSSTANSPLAGKNIDIALTTNGATLRLIADELKKAGLSRINISLDTLQTEKFFKITRRNHLANVVDGIDAAIQAGLSPVKINAVIQRGVNDDEILALASFGREKKVEVRFIEFMPLDAQGRWQSNDVVGQDEIVATINSVFPLEQVASRGAAPADRWQYLDGAGTVGVIPSVTKPFCGDCDRVRLTAEGQFRTCLFSTTEFDLRAKLRGGATDDEIAAEIARAVGTKWAGHAIGRVTFVRPKRSMSQIGG